MHFLVDEILSEVAGVLQEVDLAEVRALAEGLVSARRIVVFGAGRMGLAGRGFAMRLAHLGLHSHFLGDATVPSISDGDVFLVASGSGETRSVVLMCEIARKNGAQVFAICGRRDSSVAKLASIFTFLPAPNKLAGAIKSSSQPLTSLNEQCCWLLFDIVVRHLMVRLEQSSDDMWARHSNLE